MEFPVGRCGEERHSLYHNYSIHSNNWITKATVQFDGVLVFCFIQKRTDRWTYCPWGIGKMDVDFRFRNHYNKSYDRVKGLLSKETDSDFTLRCGCEAERTSSGAVTSLTTTAEFRLNGKIVLRFNVSRDQWEELDEGFLAVKTKGGNLTHFNQIIKHYLQQGCTDRLQSYLKYYDEHIRNRTDCSEGGTNSTYEEKKETEEKEGIGVSTVLSCIVIACVAVASVLIVKKIRKCSVVRRPAEDAYRGYSHDIENEAHAEGDPDQTETEDDDGG
ncbi:hypothetical protein MHYP_G00169920 [Metynnis hypsauchen]